MSRSAYSESGKARARRSQNRPATLGDEPLSSTAIPRPSRKPYRKNRSPYTPDQFWSLVDRSGGPNACWPFLGRIHKEGYGALTWMVDGVVQSEFAHRVAYLLTHGHLPRGRKRRDRVIRHSCDFRPCCNPAHHLTGTPIDNIADCLDRGRKPRGEAVSTAKLTDDGVRLIRSRHGLTNTELGRLLGVSDAAVRNVRVGRTWRHVR